MIDDSEKRKRQLPFELQNSRVFEKFSKFNKQQLCAITALSLLAPHVYDRCLETPNLSCTEEAKPEEAKHKLKTTNFSSFELVQVIDKSKLDRGIYNSPTLKRMSELELMQHKRSTQPLKGT